MRKAPDLALYRPPSNGQLPFSISVGDHGGDPADFVCGFLGCDARPFNPLLEALPRIIHVSDPAGGTIGACSLPWRNRRNLELAESPCLAA